jgi:methyl-accepting chemotaxis protein
MTEASTGVNEIVRNITGMADAAKDNSQQALKTKEGAEGLGKLAGRLTEIVKLFERN